MGTGDRTKNTIGQAETGLVEQSGRVAASGEVGSSGSTPFEVVLAYLEKGVSERERIAHRAAASVGEVLLLVAEVFLFGGILWFKHFHPLVIAGVLVWAGFRLLGMRQRRRANRRYHESFDRGLAGLKAGDFDLAASAFRDAMELSRQEEAALGYAYSVGLTGDKGGLLRAVRCLFRLHLYRRMPKEIVGTEAYRALLAEPAFAAVQARMRAALTGEAEELLHLAPGVLRRRLVQILVGLVSFTLLALVLTSVMTFL